MGSFVNPMAPRRSPIAFLVKASTKDQKGDVLTKEIAGPRFEECKGMLNIIPTAVTFAENVTGVFIRTGGIFSRFQKFLVILHTFSCTEAGGFFVTDFSVV